MRAQITFMIFLFVSFAGMSKAYIDFKFEKSMQLVDANFKLADDKYTELHGFYEYLDDELERQRFACGCNDEQ